MNKLFIGTPFSLSPELINNTHAGWSELRDGVAIRILFEDTKTGYSVGLIRYKPGASVPRHLHTGDEHIYVLSGSQQDERGLYPAGSYIYNPQGSYHSVSSHEGCMVLAHWHKPVQFVSE